MDSHRREAYALIFGMIIVVLLAAQSILLLNLYRDVHAFVRPQIEERAIRDKEVSDMQERARRSRAENLKEIQRLEKDNAAQPGR